MQLKIKITCMVPLPHIYINWLVMVLSQVVNTSSTERCWSTYNVIHSVKRNNLNLDRAERLVYVHWNFRLLSHYCEATKNGRTFVTWDNNPKEANLEDEAIVFELLEDEILGNHDRTHEGDHVSKMPPPSTSRFPNVAVFPLASQPSVLCGSHVLIVMFNEHFHQLYSYFFCS